MSVSVPVSAPVCVSRRKKPKDSQRHRCLGACRTLDPLREPRNHPGPPIGVYGYGGMGVWGYRGIVVRKSK
jgi:hypothetical protein